MSEHTTDNRYNAKEYPLQKLHIASMPLEARKRLLSIHQSKFKNPLDVGRGIKTSPRTVDIKKRFVDRTK